MPRDDQVRYRRIANDLRRKILTGELQPGNRLGSERALLGHYQVSRNTVRLALRELMDEGLVTSQQGIGYFVRKQDRLAFYGLPLDAGPDRGSEFDLAWMAQMRESGKDVTADLGVSTQRPPPDIAAALRLEADDLAVRRWRTKRVDGVPYAVSTGWYPEALVRGTEIEMAHDIEPDHVLAELGHAPVRYEDRITARMPAPDEQRNLELEPGTPVHDFVRVGYDGRERPVRIRVSVLPGDRFAIVYQLRAG